MFVNKFCDFLCKQINILSVSKIVKIVKMSDLKGANKRRAKVTIELEPVAKIVKKSQSAEPQNWEKVYANIKTMRESLTAPVDTMGCERTMEIGVSEEVRRYQLLISLMLSSQTKDEITYAAMTRLKQHGLTIDNILKTEESELAELIKPVGFYKKKAVYIKRATEMMQEKMDIPDTLEGLLKLPGVGPKMGIICFNVAYETVGGIGVDTHVHRISDRLGWSKNCKNPEQTRKSLEDWLPKEYWNEINVLLVGFGQTICLPVKPKCSQCINSVSNLCPFFKSGKARKRSFYLT